MLLVLLAIIGVTILRLRQIGSGVALLFVGPSSRGTLFQIHKLSFFAWLAFAGLHVLGHLPGLPATLRADYRANSGLSGYEPGRDGRVLSLVGVLVGGLVLAVLVIPQFGPWLHLHLHHH